MPRSRIASSVLIGRLLMIAVLVVPGPACGGSAHIVDPTPAITSSVDGWSVRVQATAVTGPPFCVFTPSVGTAFQTGYDVVLRGDSVAFTPADPVDWESYSATLTGSNFMAANPPQDSGVGMCTHYAQASALAGQFSADRSSFTAVETWSFTLDSGDVKTVTFSWSGARR